MRWHVFSTTVFCLLLTSLCSAQPFPENPAQVSPPGPPPGPGLGQAYTEQEQMGLPPGPPPGQGVQGPGQWGQGPRSREEARELIETIMAAKLAQDLGFTEEQTVLMVRRMSEFKKKSGDMRRERTELLNKLRSAVRAGESEDQVKQALDNLIAHDKAMAELKMAAFDDLAAGLTTTQRAKLYVAISEFENEMRGLIERARERMAGNVAEPGKRAEWPRQIPRGLGELPPGVRRPWLGQRMAAPGQPSAPGQPGAPRQPSGPAAPPLPPPPAEPVPPAPAP